MVHVGGARTGKLVGTKPGVVEGECSIYYRGHEETESLNTLK